MDQTHVITDANKQPLFEQIKAKAKQARDSKALKPVLGFVALGIGAYLGAKQPMKQIAGDVHTMADRTKRIDHNLFTYASQTIERAHEQDAEVLRQRDTIKHAMNAGEDFQFYPGLGVLRHSAGQGAKPAKKG